MSCIVELRLYNVEPILGSVLSNISTKKIKACISTDDGSSMGPRRF